MRNGARWAVAWFVFLALSALFSPLFFERASAMDAASLLDPPSLRHLLGTDSLGRDLLLRVLCGTGVSLSVGLVSVGISVVVGTLVGAAAGYWGGWRDRALMALVDVMLCFPTFFLILAVIAVLGPGIFNIMAIIGLTSWMGTARLVRAEVLSLKEREFVLAARALGAGPARVIFRHLVPNALAPVIVNAVLGVSAAVLLESGLSFLGIGVQPPAPSWGNILTDGKATLGYAWWLTVVPGTMIFLTVLAANVAGESLQTASRGERHAAS